MSLTAVMNLHCLSLKHRMFSQEYIPRYYPVRIRSCLGSFECLKSVGASSIFFYLHAVFKGNCGHADISLKRLVVIFKTGFL